MKNRKQIYFTQKYDKDKMQTVRAITIQIRVGAVFSRPSHFAKADLSLIQGKSKSYHQWGWCGCRNT